MNARTWCIAATVLCLLHGSWQRRAVIAQEAPAPKSAATYESWQRRCAALKKHPHILRHYTFETMSAEDPVAQSVAGEPEPIRYVEREPLRIVEGRWPGKKAVRLDKGFFEGEPFGVENKSFTVECWFRKHGQGAELGNGHTNGMIFAQGDGYWHGLRVWSTYPDKGLRFEIGRPKPDHAFGLSARDAVPDGVWLHLAATWDSKHMRLYLNGLLLARTAYQGEYTPPNAPFRVGFADAGVGSLIMDVDEVAVYSRALSPAEILRSCQFHAALPTELAQFFMDADKAVAEADWANAGDAFERILDARPADSGIRALARLALGRTLTKRKRVREATSEYAAVFDDKSAPPDMRSVALRLCVYVDSGAANPVASRDMYERLLALPDLSQTERMGLLRDLAERCRLDGDFGQARKHYSALLDMPSFPPRERWHTGLQIAHTHLQERDYDAARAEYAKCAQCPNAPYGFASHAMLCTAHAFMRERNYSAAVDVLERVRGLAQAPAHHRAEAQERIREIQRTQRGAPARDPAASRVKVPPFPKPAVALYVATDGSDANAGTPEKPFATLDRARDALRASKVRGPLPRGGATVFVNGGSYQVAETFELDDRDSGTPDAPVVYRAMPGQKPVFTGGVRVGGFGPVTDAAALERIPAPARGKVVKADLEAQGITDCGQVTVRGYGVPRYPCRPWVDLYFNGVPRQLARWPNKGFVKVGEVHAGRYRTKDSRKPGVFEYDGDRPRRWSQAKDVWMFGLWGHLWAGRCVRAASFDLDRRQVATAHSTSYGFREGQPFYYLNLLEELDQPGEWHIDREAGTLYLYPPADVATAVVELPIFSQPFVKMDNVSHVTLLGLTFDLGRTDGAAIAGGRQNLLAGCTFRRLGGNGVIVHGGTGHGVLGCDIHRVGAGGLRVRGGDYKTLTPARHFVENTHVFDFSRVDRAYAPAVHLDGVGIRVAHNLFHESPHHALRIEGFDHTIEFNEVHSCVYESDDQAGIDIWGNPTYRGLVIRHNFFHHIGSGHQRAGQAGIRLDDYISGVLMYGNVFYRCSGGHFGAIQIHGGKDNIADNNLMVDCKAAFSFSPWGQKLWEERLKSESMAQRLARMGVDVSKPVFVARYADLAHMAENADRNFIWRNVAVRCGQFAMRERGVNEMFDNVALSADPGFADASKREFRLPPHSGIYDRLAFRPIPFGEIGLYRDEFRATWPVEHKITPHYFREY